MRVLVLDDDDVTLIRAMLDRERKQRVNVVKPVDERAGWIPPEVYVVQTPTGGIPALAEEPPVGTGTAPGPEPPWTGTAPGDVPGSAVCDVHMVLDRGGRKEVWYAGFSVLVYNFAPYAVAGGLFVPVLRDKWGVWMVPNMGLLFGTC